VALLANIPPNLRGIEVEYQEKDKMITWINYFDQEPTQQDIDLLSSAASQVISWYEESTLKELNNIVPFSQKLEVQFGVWMYLRFEEGL